jgi:hypothetical protein
VTNAYVYEYKLGNVDFRQYYSKAQSKMINYLPCTNIITTLFQRNSVHFLSVAENRSRLEGSQGTIPNLVFGRRGRNAYIR